MIDLGALSHDGALALGGSVFGVVWGAVAMRVWIRWRWGV